MPRTRRHHHGGLLLIALYKFANAALFLAVGVGAHNLLHKDLSETVLHFVHHLRFNPESRLVDLLLERVSLITDPMIRRIEVAAFAYAALGTAEGVGLYLEKAWGEILTLLLTASFLPLECVELIHRQTWVRASLFAINLVVLLYLIPVILRQRRRRAASRDGSAPV
jgi:uncharacterized membrane protein (DUF2068 family)